MYGIFDKCRLCLDDEESAVIGKNIEAYFRKIGWKRFLCSLRVEEDAKVLLEIYLSLCKSDSVELSALEMCILSSVLYDGKADPEKAKALSRKLDEMVKNEIPKSFC